MTQIKAHIPKIRFKEFSSEWEEKEFGNFVNKEKGKYNPKTSSENLTCIELESIEQNTGGLLNTFDSKKQESIKNIFKQGNVLYSKLRPYLNKYYYAKFDGVCSSEIWVLNGLKTDNNFLYYIIQTSKFSKVANISFGSKMPRSDWDFVSGTPFGIPSLPEQQKIASFLSLVDEKIEKIKEKKKNLEEYKKGVMQKIFSQELRFKDENGEEFGEWEEKKIGEIFEVTRGYVLAMTELKEKNDDFFKYPVYSSQTKNNGLAGYYNDFLYENAITWTTDGANAGDVKFRKGKFYCTNVCGVLLSKEGYANLLIAELLNSITHKYVSYVGNPKLMNNVMSNIVLKIPSSIKEQERVADFLSGIDEKIEKVSDELEKMEEFKKGLLQGMFV